MQTPAEALKSIAEKIVDDLGFTLKSMVGQGASGSVFLVESDHKNYVLKLYQQVVSDNATALGRFYLEAAVLSRVTHPQTLLCTKSKVGTRT